MTATATEETTTLVGAVNQALTEAMADFDRVGAKRIKAERRMHDLEPILGKFVEFFLKGAHRSMRRRLTAHCEWRAQECFDRQSDSR